MGRKSIGNAPMTAAQRQQRRRDHIKGLMKDPLRRFRHELYDFLNARVLMNQLTWDQIFKELGEAEVHLKVHQHLLKTTA